MDESLLGVMVWDLSYDDFQTSHHQLLSPLLSLIRAVLTKEDYNLGDFTILPHALRTTKAPRRKGDPDSPCG